VSSVIPPARWCTLRLASLAEIVARIPASADEAEIRRRLRGHVEVLEVFDATLGDDWAHNAAAPLPVDRDHCPKERPCGHFLCQYHLALEVTRHGSLRLVEPGTPLNEQETCLYDWIDRNPDGVSFAEVGRHLALKRTRMCQLWQALVGKVVATGMLPPPEPAPQPRPPRPPANPRGMPAMSRPDEYVVQQDSETALQNQVADAGPDTGPTYASHPLARIFRALSGPEFEALVADIKAHGQREPIVLHEGQILDGRNRYYACKRAGIKPDVRLWEPKAGESPIDFVLSANLHRRHLSESQRAMLAVQLKPLYDAEARQRQFATLNTDVTPPVTRNGVELEHGESADLVGRRLDISGDTVRRAVKVSEHGVPRLIELVEQDQVSVSAAAAVATLSASRQDQLLDTPDPGATVTTVAARIRKRTKHRNAAPPKPVDTYAPSDFEAAHSWVTKHADECQLARLLHCALDTLAHQTRTAATPCSANEVPRRRRRQCDKRTGTTTPTQPARAAAVCSRSPSAPPAPASTATTETA
jgi:hypothetical protein